MESQKFDTFLSELSKDEYNNLIKACLASIDATVRSKLEKKTELVVSFESEVDFKKIILEINVSNSEISLDFIEATKSRTMHFEDIELMVNADLFIRG